MIPVTQGRKLRKGTGEAVVCLTYTIVNTILYLTYTIMNTMLYLIYTTLNAVVYLTYTLWTYFVFFLWIELSKNELL